jgi:hypothetical protein
MCLERYGEHRASAAVFVPCRYLAFVRLYYGPCDESPRPMSLSFSFVFVTNLLKSTGNISSGMPVPSAIILTSTVSLSWLLIVCIVMVPFLANFAALSMMKRRSVDRVAAAEMQIALKKTLDLFDGDAKDVLLFCLYKEHGVSVYESENLSRKKIDSAFSALFGRGASILMEKFDSEMKSL